MRAIYGFFIATVGFAMWLGPLLLIGYGGYQLYSGSVSGVAFILGGVVSYFLFKRLAGGLVNAGDMILTDELKKQKRDS